MRDILLEARTQLAYARMAAGWLDDQVWEHLGHFDTASTVSAGSPAEVALLQSQAEFFRSALQPALAGAIVLSVFSLLEQSLQRICERHAAYDRGGGGWARTEGSGVGRAVAYLRGIGGGRLSRSGLLRELNDLRLIRNHLAHRGPDFRSAPPGAAGAGRRRGVLREDGTADPETILQWMFDLQVRLLDRLEEDLAGPPR